VHAIIEKIEKEQMKTSLPELKIGSTLKVTSRILEEGKERLQVFTGVLIAKKARNCSQGIVLRRVTAGTGVERIFKLHSPLLSSIEVIREGKVRRAKLYYLRNKIGKETRIEEKKTEMT